jgi:hypothetical protein
MGKNEGADELLSAFNVATFKSAEDDKAFWNRLIPVDVQNTETGKQQVQAIAHVILVLQELWPLCFSTSSLGVGSSCCHHTLHKIYSMSAHMHPSLQTCV